MKLSPLTDKGDLLARTLTRESKVFFGRHRKLSSTFESLVSLNEPAAILPIVPFLFDDDSRVAKEAGRALESIFERVEPHLLPGLDESVRSECYWGGPLIRPGNRRQHAVQLLSTVPKSVVPIGLISSHGNGYLREAATECLDREIKSGDEIPFLLMRTNDWVVSVRAAAERALESRVTDSNINVFRRHLNLIALLEKRQRASASPLLRKIKFLLQNDVIALVDHTLLARDPVERRFGLNLALECVGDLDAGRKSELLSLIISSRDPGTRLHVALWLTKASAMPDLQFHFLPRLIDDRYFSVRRTSLAWCAVRAPHDYLDRIHAALLDECYPVRAIAHFHLPKLEDLDIRGFYLQALNSCSARNLKAVICGLSETGRSEDAGLILPFLNSDNPKFAKAALAALANLNPTTHFNHSVDALQSQSRKVSRQALVNLNGHASLVTAAKLSEIFYRVGYEHVRCHTLTLINDLPKWQKLPLLIKIQNECQDETGRQARRYLFNWLFTYNKTHHIQPLQSEIEMLRESLHEHGASLDRRLRLEFENLAGIPTAL
jgi:HEAT repeat protein